MEIMNALQLKQRIHEYIDQADERFLRLVHSMVESEEFEKDLFSTSKDDIVTRTKKSMESINKGNTRNILEFKKDVCNWKQSRTTQLK